ncbi:hypothetical protein TRAPUB_13971 [Trametes pubescens]|uniref:Uncharacterized protein n=1 Tax=Trametes pubescens TaxID=154538 RepID=A0A1M2VPR6_TRAPU|nr:hypothetical protein TRAPUB_13971 [Trametes pubescens]
MSKAAARTKLSQRTRALDVHEVGVGGLHEALELVPALLGISGGVEEVDGESLVDRKS